MKRLIFIFALVIFAVMAFACASFSSSNKIGTQVEFDGGTALCVYDQDVKAESFGQNTTCSFTVKQGDVVYQCEKIKLSSINKDFKLETNCSIILDLREKGNAAKRIHYDSDEGAKVAVLPSERG